MGWVSRACEAFPSTTNHTRIAHLSPMRERRKSMTSSQVTLSRTKLFLPRWPNSMSGYRACVRASVCERASEGPRRRRQRSNRNQQPTTPSPTTNLDHQLRGEKPRVVSCQHLKVKVRADLDSPSGDWRIAFNVGCDVRIQPITLVPPNPLFHNQEKNPHKKAIISSQHAKGRTRTAFSSRPRAAATIRLAWYSRILRRAIVGQ